MRGSEVSGSGQRAGTEGEGAEAGSVAGIRWDGGGCQLRGRKVVKGWMGPPMEEWAEAEERCPEDWAEAEEE